MLMVDLMFVLFRLKLDKFYFIGVMDQLKIICYDLSFVHIKIAYYWFYRRKLSRKARDRYHYGGGKEKATRYYCKNREI